MVWTMMHQGIDASWSRKAKAKMTNAANYNTNSDKQIIVSSQSWWISTYHKHIWCTISGMWLVWSQWESFFKYIHSSVSTLAKVWRNIDSIICLYFFNITCLMSNSYTISTNDLFCILGRKIIYFPWRQYDPCVQLKLHI